MNKITYNLSSISGFDTLVNTLQMVPEDEKYYSICQYTTKSNQKYFIIKYYKDFLGPDIIGTYGLLRSVILAENTVVSFAPPKTMSPDIFMNKYPVKSDSIVAEEFIEGTMMNVFYDHRINSWQIATRNTIGAEVCFYGNKTFNTMFMEACASNQLDLNSLNTKYCYSFVLQHPDNRIVIPFKNPQLYLIAVYEIKQDKNEIMIIQHDLSLVKEEEPILSSSVGFPKNYEFSNYSELITQFGSANTSYDIMGVILKNSETGEITKIRNPIYEQVRQLRGNQPKLQYQYLCLRHAGKLPEFLKYYPETKEDMSHFRDQVHMFTKTLHSNYISCYVKKEKPLNEYLPQYRTHMFKLHEIFLSELREKSLYVTNTVVMKYVNKLSPSLLMYSLNYHLRKQLVDTIKADTSV